MKLTKASYHLLLRFLAGIAASLILVGAIAMIDQSAGKNLFKNASGIKPTEVVMIVNGQDISAEEYLYWLSYSCDYYNEYLRYMGIDDWNTELSEGFTAGDYIAQQADMQTISMVTQYAVIDGWTQEVGIALTDEDLADIDAQRAVSVEQLGGENAYQQWLQSLGVSDAFISRSLGHTYLINHLSDAYCTEGSAVYPGKERLDAYLDEHEYFGASILFVDTCEMSKEAKDSALKEMKGYVSELRAAKDLDATFTEIAAEMALDPSAVTFTSGEMEVGFIAGLEKVDIGSVSDVITTEEGYYVAIRRQPELEGILQGMLNEEFADRCVNAEIAYNDKVYGSINTLTFYKKLLSAREASVA